MENESTETVRKAIVGAGGVIVDTGDTGGGGNTSPPPKKDPRARAWILTWNNPPDTPLTQVTREIRGLDQWAGQLEVGENGTPHYQFCLRFKNARAFSALKAKLPGCHIEKCMDWPQSVRYCTKKDTRKEGPWASHDHLLPKREWGWEPVKRAITLKPWQVELEKELSETEPHPRTIIWYVDKVGGAGKTEFCIHMMTLYKGVYMASGRIQDMIYAIMKEMEERGDDEVRAIFMDVPRATENFISYSGLESIKNGILANTKYESKTKLINIPHVVVMSNWEPEMEKMSMDRWDIRYLDDEDRQVIGGTQEDGIER